ncbi:MAG: hypothetical protein V4719_02485 [Planctomycetota bacterium]
MSQAPTYRIREWERHFETHESRKRKGPLTWVGVPTKHDGRGFNRLKRQQDWPALYGCWVLVLAIAAKCPTRGVLADEDGPFTAMDIADKVGMSEDLVQRCLDLLTSPETGVMWLEVSAVPGTQPHVPADSSRLAADLPQTPAGISTDPQISGPTRHNQTRHNQTLKNQTEPDGAISGSGAKANATGDKPRASKAKGSVFSWLKSEDLQDVGKLIEWYRRVSRGPNPVVGSTESDRLNVVAAAVKCWDKADDPLKLFAWIVGKNRWDFIGQEHEDTAHQLIKQHLAGGTVPALRTGGISTSRDIVTGLFADMGVAQ